MLTIIPHTAYMSISIIFSHKGISLVEQIAVGVSVGLCIIIISTIALVLLVVCGFMHRRRTSGEWKETNSSLKLQIYSFHGSVVVTVRPLFA